LLGGNARTAVLKDILRYSGATAVRKEARGVNSSNTGKSESKRSKKTDTDSTSTPAAAVAAAAVADDKEPSDSSPTTDDNKEVNARFNVYCMSYAL
jgi:hypothetical protein